MGESKAWIQSHRQGRKIMEIFQSPESPNHGTLGSKNHGVAAKKRTLAHPVGFPHFTDVGRELAISGQASFLKDELLPMHGKRDAHSHSRKRADLGLLASSQAPVASEFVSLALEGLPGATPSSSLDT